MKLCLYALSLFLLHFAGASSGETIVKEISFPFFENEFTLPDNSFEIKFRELEGQLKISNTTVKGLDTLNINAELDPKTGQSSSSVRSASTVGISGNYELLLSGKTLSGYHLSFTGKGFQSNSIQNLSLTHTALLTDGSSGFLELSNLQIDLDFDLIELGFDNFSVNDFSLNWIWKPVNRFLNTNLKELLLEIEGPMVELITRRANSFFQEQKLTLKELVTVFGKTA